MIIYPTEKMNDISVTCYLDKKPFEVRMLVNVSSDAISELIDVWVNRTVKSKRTKENFISYINSKGFKAVLK